MLFDIDFVPLPGEWHEIKKDDEIKFCQYVPLMDPVNNVSKDPKYIDKTFPGYVNGIEAEIGCRTWVQNFGITGPGECDLYQPIQWRAWKNGV